MPTMNFTGIAISPSSNIRAGDSIINEVCMVNIGTAGDMIYYTGFGYLISGTIRYIGDGWGNGYSEQTIGAVGINEHLCPYDMVSATQEVIDVSKSGKDVRFFASVGSKYISKSVTFYEPPTPEFCTQVFEIIDQDGYPLRGTISSPTWDTDLPIPNTGVASMYMQKGVTHTVTAHHADKTDTWTFTTCQTDPVTLVIQVESTVGLLVCNSSPDDAEIWIDGSNTSEYTPRSFTNMEKGSYNITFKKDGYHDCSKTVTVIVDQAVSAFCSLTKTITTGQLNCSTDPIGAKIYLNNEYIDVTNVNIIDLEPRTYDVRYELEGYEVYTKTVTIEAGKTTYLAKVLVPIEEQDIPTLTTTIITEEPYVVGTNIGIETVLKTPLGIPIQGDIVYFYTPTEFLGANFTNSEGEVAISFKTGNIPATYEIYVTHLTDNDIFVESNHIVFTTEEPTIPYCTQKLRTLDQEGNTLAGKFSSTEFGDVFTNGEFEFNVEEGKTLTITAYWYNLSLTETITTCTTEPIDFIFDTEEPGKGIIEVQDITHELIDEDEIKISVPITNLTNQKYGFALRFYSSITTDSLLIELEPDDCAGGLPFPIYVEAGETRIIELNSSGNILWDRNTVFNKNCLLVLNRGCTNDILDQTLLYFEEETEPNIGEIGEITHEIVGTTIKDEVKFTIPITNLSLGTRTYQVQLFDESGKSIDTEPDLGEVIDFNTTEDVTLQSELKLWNVEDIHNQTLTFKLWSWPYPGNITDKAIVDIKQYTMPEVEGIKDCKIYIPGTSECLITEDQWKFIKWTGIAIGGLYVFSVAAPAIKGVGKVFEKSQK